MVAERPKRTVYSIPGAITGSIIGATAGTTLGVYTASRIIKEAYEEGRGIFENVLFIPTTFEGEILKYSLAMLVIPAFLVAGGSICAYVGGRVFGRSE